MYAGYGFEKDLWNMFSIYVQSPMYHIMYSYIKFSISLSIADYLEYVYITLLCLLRLMWLLFLNVKLIYHDTAVATCALQCN